MNHNTKLLLISAAVLSVYFGSFFAIMDEKKPAWKDGVIESTVSVKWAKTGPLFVQNRTVFVKKWSVLNAFFYPAEKTVNLFRGKSRRLEELRSEW